MRKYAALGNKGFVFIELVIVVGILAALLGIVIINVGNIRTSASVSTSVETFLNDIKNQQTKAMVGDTEGRGIPDTYSILIQSSKYTMFHGLNYSASDNTNFSVPIDSSYQISSTFPGNQISFATSSGEIINYTSGKDTVTIKNSTTNEQKTIQFSKFGTIISVN